MTPDWYDRLAARLAPHGLIPRGAFHAGRGEEGLPGDARTVALVGNAGPAMWAAFSAARRPEDAPDELDAWTRRVLDPLAAALGAVAVYPFDGPPFHPFQAWATRAEGLKPSPIGVLLHPDFGPWHAWRGALLFREALPLPPRPARPHPCETCAEKPCLSACPVGAFTAEGYDWRRCQDHVAAPAGTPCRDGGCLARHACPVGTPYAPDQAAFHMAAFIGRR